MIKAAVECRKFEKKRRKGEEIAMHRRGSRFKTIKSEYFQMFVSFEQNLTNPSNIL